MQQVLSMILQGERPRGRPITRGKAERKTTVKIYGYQHVAH